MDSLAHGGGKHGQHFIHDAIRPWGFVVAKGSDAFMKGCLV